MIRRKSFNFSQGDLVVAVDANIGSELPEILHEVVGEGIVVVYQQYPFHDSPPAAKSSASLSAALLANTSACSFSGTLSATMPAPA